MRMQKAKRQQENRVAIVKYDNEQRKKKHIFLFLNKIITMREYEQMNKKSSTQ